VPKVWDCSPEGTAKPFTPVQFRAWPPDIRPRSSASPRLLRSEIAISFPALVSFKTNANQRGTVSGVSVGGRDLLALFAFRRCLDR
jgi:hypothetical protein